MLSLTALIRSPLSHPWRWILAVMVVLVMFPAIDITVSSWFYRPAEHVFIARSWPPAEWVRRAMPHFLFAAAGYVLVLWLAGEAMGQVFLGVTRRVAAFLLLSLALGPGLLVNVILKDGWGRPRPSTVVEFGGSQPFTPPLVMTDRCDYNCSFPSGHAALAFWLVAFALLAPKPWRGWAMAAALAFGTMVGVVRIAQGGHFLSDVITSAILTIGLTLWLYRRLVTAAKADGAENNAPLDRDSR